MGGKWIQQILCLRIPIKLQIEVSLNEIWILIFITSRNIKRIRKIDKRCGKLPKMLLEYFWKLTPRLQLLHEMKTKNASPLVKSICKQNMSTHLQQIYFVLLNVQGIKERDCSWPEVYMCSLFTWEARPWNVSVNQLSILLITRMMNCGKENEYIALWEGETEHIWTFFFCFFAAWNTINIKSDHQLISAPNKMLQ